MSFVLVDVTKEPRKEASEGRSPLWQSVKGCMMVQGWSQAFPLLSRPGSKEPWLEIRPNYNPQRHALSELPPPNMSHASKALNLPPNNVTSWGPSVYTQDPVRDSSRANYYSTTICLPQYHHLYFSCLKCIFIIIFLYVKNFIYYYNKI